MFKKLNQSIANLNEYLGRSFHFTYSIEIILLKNDIKFYYEEKCHRY